MELKLVDLVRKMEQDNPDLQYFEKGSFVMKPVYYKQTHRIHMELSLPSVLPFDVWNVFCMRLAKITRCQVEVMISAEDKTSDLVNIADYIRNYVERHPGLRIFSDSLPSLEKTYLIYCLCILVRSWSRFSGRL